MNNPCADPEYRRMTARVAELQAKIEAGRINTREMVNGYIGQIARLAGEIKTLETELAEHREALQKCVAAIEIDDSEGLFEAQREAQMCLNRAAEESGR